MRSFCSRSRTLLMVLGSNPRPYKPRGEQEKRRHEVVRQESESQCQWVIVTFSSRLLIGQWSKLGISSLYPQSDSLARHYCWVTKNSKKNISPLSVFICTISNHRLRARSKSEGNLTFKFCIFPAKEECIPTC